MYQSVRKTRGVRDGGEACRRVCVFWSPTRAYNTVCKRLFISTSVVRSFILGGLTGGSATLLVRRLLFVHVLFDGGEAEGGRGVCLSKAEDEARAHSIG